MNKISKSFLCSLVLSSLCGTLPFSAFAKYCNGGGSQVDAGYYCMALTRRDCEPGCYCTGHGKNFTWAVGDVERGCRERWGKITSSLSPTNNIYLCPDEFPHSDRNADNEEKCYAESKSKRVYNKYVHCGKGTYLPASSEQCEVCPDEYYCPNDSSYHTNLTEDQGYMKCNGGKQPTADKTACEDVITSCDKGEYFSYSENTCVICKTDEKIQYYCPGVTTINRKTKSDQGLKECAKGKMANEEQTDCVDREEIDCEPGQYAPAGPLECKKCTSTTEFCPGGHFKKSSSDQGKYTCPFNSRSNSDHASCSVTLTKEQMKYGPAALANKNSATGSTIEETQCWLYNSSEEYRACILGVSNSNANKSRAK